MNWFRIASFAFIMLVFSSTLSAEHPLASADDARWTDYLAGEYRAQIERVIVAANHDGVASSVGDGLHADVLTRSIGGTNRR